MSEPTTQNTPPNTDQSPTGHSRPVIGVYDQPERRSMLPIVIAVIALLVIGAVVLFMVLT
jgi:hypothetical protein